MDPTECHRSAPVLVLASLLAIGSCSEDATAPTPSPPDPVGTGSIQVEFLAPGPTVDGDGYSVAVDGAAARAVATNGVVVFDDLAPGTHQVTVDGLAANCVLDGGPTYSQSVVADVVTTLVLTPWCVGAIPADIAIVFNTGSEGFLRGFPLGLSSPDLAGVREDGTGEESIVTGVHPDSTIFDWTFADPVWSPDGSQLLIVREGNLTAEIWLAQADGTGVRHLASGRLPSWSPDGLRIAYLTGSTQAGTLRMINVDGSGDSSLDLGFGVLHVAWSPDGARLAVGGPGVELTLVDPDGSNPTSIDLPTGAGAREPSWSPDGSTLAFRAAMSDGDPWTLWTAAADGSGAEELLALPGAENVRRPEWSPSGGRILFSSYVVRCGANGNLICPADLFVVNADGTQLEALVERSGPDEMGSWRNTP